MLRNLTSRLGLAIFSMFFVSAVVFFSVEALPGDLCTAYLDRYAQGPRLERCRVEQGLDRSVPMRYLAWVGGLLQGDFGTSLKMGTEVSEVVAERFANTALLATAAALAGVPIAVLLGFLAGLRRDRPVDLIISTIAMIAMTVPEFVTASLMIFLFAITLQWFPAITVVPPSAPLADFMPNLVLPALVLALVMSAHILRMTRAAVIEVAGSDFVQMARLKGVPDGQINRRHIAPSALIPTVNVIALTVAWLLGGVVVIEQVFNYPGLGTLMLQAIYNRDLPLVQAIALIFSAIFIGVNLAADLVIIALDPRLRT